MTHRLSQILMAITFFTPVALNQLSQAGKKKVILPELAKDGQMGYVKSELIYPLRNRPTPQCHASTIIETKSGLMAAWFGGTRERNRDVGIWISHLDGNEWSKPVEVANGVQSPKKRYPCWNPVLFRPKKGPLMLLYKIGPTPRSWWGVVKTSEDDGKTWSEPRRLGANKKIGNLIGPVKNQPIQLEDGTILSPSSTEHQGWRVHFEVSKDQGKTWVVVVGPINDGSKFSAIQPAILTHPDGKLQILCRSKQGVIVQSWSTDKGQSWSKLTATKLPNPNSGIAAITLSDGRHLLVYNHTRFGRSPLNVAISNDGENWTPILTLENTRGEYSYPFVMQSSDGKVHLTYTFRRHSVKHVVLDPKGFPN